MSVPMLTSAGDMSHRTQLVNVVLGCPWSLVYVSIGIFNSFKLGNNVQMLGFMESHTLYLMGFHLWLILVNVKLSM